MPNNHDPGEISPDDDRKPKFRPTTDADVDEVVAMLQLAFETWPPVDITVTPQEHLRWKLTSHPLATETNTVMILDGSIVATVVQFAREVQVGGEMLISHSGSDTSVHPRVQGTGLLRFTAPYADQHIQARYDFSFNTESHHPRLRQRNARLQLQTRFANQLRILVRTFDTKAFVGVHLKRGGWRHLASTAAGAARRRATPDAKSAELEVTTIELFDDRFDRLWQAAADEFTFLPDRRAPFLNWRYLDPRGGESLVRAVLEGDEVAGYSVLRSQSDRVVIADMLAAPGRLDVVGALVGDAARIAEEEGAPTLSCALPAHHPYREALLEAAFHDVGDDARLQYRPHGDRSEQLAFLGDDPEAAIHLTFGDFDYT